MKKIELLSQEIEKLREMNEEKDTKYSNLSLSHKSLVTQEATVKNELHRLEANYEVLKAEFGNEKNHRVALEREIESLSAAESDKNIFKKKYNESFQQLSKANEKHDRLQSIMGLILIYLPDR
jgi:chromosome segregation ATPase